MNVIITGGGTGGHIYPAIAIADALKFKYPLWNILFIGANGMMEMMYIPQAGYPIKGIDISGISRKSFFKNLLLPIKIIKSVYQSACIIKQFKPDIVIGTGGYVSFPMSYVATNNNIPVIIHEQNAFPGITNRILSRWVNKVCVAYDGLDKYFPSEKIVFTGNPVRSKIADFKNINKYLAYDYLNLDSNKKCLLVLGGSLGARTINYAFIDHINDFIKNDIQVLWVTGKAYFDYINSVISDDIKKYIKVYPYLDSIEMAYRVADVIVSRGGALTIAELCVVQKPVIFIPSPNVAGNHQMHNIMPLVTSNAALWIKNDNCINKLAEMSINLINDYSKQLELINNIKNWYNNSAVNDIMLLIEDIVLHKKT